MHNLIDLILLGFLQGVTEFLPISSSGHLQLGQWLLGFKEQPLLVNVCLHVGTLVATLVVFRREVLWLLVPHWIEGEEEDLESDAPSRKALIWGLVVATAITALFGLAIRRVVILTTGQTLWLGPAWILSGIALWATRWANGPQRNISPFGALIVGVAQSIALFPGATRSGLTIAAGMLLGWGRRWSATFSFLLSVPSIAGALLLELLEERGSPVPWGYLLVAAAVSFLVGWASLMWLMGLVRRGRIWGFAFYCWAMACVVAFVWLMG